MINQTITDLFETFTRDKHPGLYDLLHQPIEQLFNQSGCQLMRTSINLSNFEIRFEFIDQMAQDQEATFCYAGGWRNVIPSRLQGIIT